jgi:tetratricopeptide (TPR) repeat protein
MPDNPRIEELRRRVESDPASIAFAALAEEYRRTGRNEEAIDICRTGLQRHPAYLSARVTLGRALIEVGDFESARAELETVLKSAPENLAAIRGLAQIHERLGHSAEMHPDLAALAAQPLPVREAPAVEPDLPPAPDLRGPAYTDAAVRGPAYTDAAARGPGDTGADLPPAPDLRGPAYTDAAVRGPADTGAADESLQALETAQPLKIDLPDTAGGHTALEIDLPAPSPVHQTLEIDLPLEGERTEGFEIDLPAHDTAEAETSEPASAAAPIDASPIHDAALDRLEQFLVALQHARRSLGEGGPLHP